MAFDFAGWVWDWIGLDGLVFIGRDGDFLTI
jgi:hypothetical protein